MLWLYGPHNPYTHMKTTIDIADNVFLSARRLADKRGTTLKALVEQGLRRVLADKQRDGQFRFEPVTDGRPAQAGAAQPLPWEQVRDMIYEGRGT